MATALLQRLSDSSRSRISRQLETFGYWAAMTSLAIATLYLWYLALSSSQTSDVMDLGWGASTPRWLVRVLAAVSGCPLPGRSGVLVFAGTTVLEKYSSRSCSAVFSRYYAVASVSLDISTSLNIREND